MVVLALACALAACGKSKTACKAEVDDLMTFLRAMDHKGSLFQIGDDLHLLARPDLPDRDAYLGPALEVRPSELRFESRSIARAALADALAAKAAQVRDELAHRHVPRSLIGKIDPAVVYLLIDEAAPWRSVVDVMQLAADAGFEHPALVFFGKPQLAAPPRTWVEDEFAKRADPSQSATEIAGITRKIASSCKPLMRVYGTVGGGEGSTYDLAAEIIEGTGPALVDCNCDVDMAALRSVMYLVMATPHPTKLIPIVLAHDGTPIELPAATPWRDAAAKLSPGARMWPVAK